MGPYLCCVDVVDEVQGLVEDPAHVKVQLLQCPDILHSELSACV